MRRDAAISSRPKSEPPPRVRTSERAELPLGDLPAPPPTSETEPEVYLPPIGRPTVALRAHLAALWLRDRLVTLSLRSRAWVRGVAWPWLLARARDKTRMGRSILVASLLAVCGLLAVGIRACVGGSTSGKLSEPPVSSSGP
jgi:hypothetical protein